MPAHFLQIHAEKHLNKLVQIQPIRTFPNHHLIFDFFSRQTITFKRISNYN